MAYSSITHISIDEVRCDCGLRMLQIFTSEYECRECGKKKNTWQSDKARRVHCSMCDAYMDGGGKSGWACNRCGLLMDHNQLEWRYWLQVMKCRNYAMIANIASYYVELVKGALDPDQELVWKELKTWVNRTWNMDVKKFIIDHSCNNTWEQTLAYFKLKLKLTPMPDELRRKVHGSTTTI